MLDISILSNDMVIDLDVEQGGSGGRLPAYTGEFVITPHPFETQILETKNKSVTDDITVKKIPYSEVTNPEGGVTANIAYEI